jgi:hypothetical protein
MLGLFALPAFFGGAASVASMWQIQFMCQIPLVVIGLFLEFAGVTGSWPLELKNPGCSLSPGTYMAFQVFWYLPFVAIIYWDPNYIMGPASPTGFPMFLTEFTEPALWFGKGWATATFLVCLCPYLFGFSMIEATKMITVVYVLDVALFTYGLLTADYFNDMVIIPLTCFNGLMLAVGAYLSFTSKTDYGLMA